MFASTRFTLSGVALALVAILATSVFTLADDFVEPAITSTTNISVEQTDTTTKAIPEDAVPQYLQDISVTIAAQGAQGSGVFKVTKDGQVWVWTCGHLIEHARKVRSTSDNKPVVEFDDVRIIKTLVEEGRKVGELSFDAEVIRYSDADHGQDLALLRLRTKQYKPAQSVVFYLDSKLPPVGTKLFHCGSLLGIVGANSLTNGILSQHGRVMFGTIFDQTTCASWPGSSGGVICFEKDGRYVGMLVRGAGETFGLMVPVRRMHDWAKKVGIEFSMDDSKKIPTDQELKRHPIDDSLTRKPANHPDIDNGSSDKYERYFRKMIFRSR